MPSDYQWLLGEEKAEKRQNIKILISAFAVPILDWVSSLVLAKLAFKAAGIKSYISLQIIHN